MDVDHLEAEITRYQQGTPARVHGETERDPSLIGRIVEQMLMRHDCGWDRRADHARIAELERECGIGKPKSSNG